jgi:hypothetical protein
MLIFEHSRATRSAPAQAPALNPTVNLPERFRRQSSTDLPEVSEMQAVRTTPGFRRKISRLIRIFIRWVPAP